MRWLALLLAVVGCGFRSPAASDAGGGSDGNGANCTPWITRGGHVKDVCSTPSNGASWAISSPGGTYNTDDRTYSAGESPPSYPVIMYDQVEMLVVSVESFSIAAGASLRVVGSRPLLVLSTSTINVAGRLDVSSQRQQGPGAGADLSGCSAAGNGEGTADSGGGGGGGFKNNGGRGGNGNNNANQGGQGAGSTSRPMLYIHGGCPGGNGGTGGAPAGVGGSGGGAVQLTAKDAITIVGTLHAGGLGGQGATGGVGGGGGGGGGSGGFIGLDAPKVNVTASAVLAANGGGGGAGCRSGTGAGGQDGQTMNVVASAGDQGSCQNGASGGTGSAQVMPTADGGLPGSYGGGGGGGGLGYIVAWTPGGSAFTKESGAVVTPDVDRVMAIEK